MGSAASWRSSSPGHDLVVAAEDDRIADAAGSFEAEPPEGIPIQARAVPADLAAYDGVETLWRAVRLGGRTPGAVAIRSELRDTGVTVTALMPGPTDTEFFGRVGMEGTKLMEQTSKDDPAQVAREGFEALLAGQDHVVAGSAKNKAQVAAGRVMPETTKAKMLASQTEPGSGQPADRPGAKRRPPVSRSRRSSGMWGTTVPIGLPGSRSRCIRRVAAGRSGLVHARCPHNREDQR